MKRTVRRGVFETNSSSTHSITIKKCSGCNSKIDKDASFEIRSPLAKVVQMLGLIANAEKDFERSANEIDYEHEGDSSIKKQILNEIDDESLKSIDVDSISTYELVKTILESDSGKALCNGFYVSLDDDIASCFYNTEISARQTVLKFKEAMLAEFCAIENITMEEAMARIDFEAFGNVEIRNILKDESSAKEKLFANMEYNYKFKREFEKSGSDDIVAFAKEYIITDAKEFKEMVNGKISCELYFANGCLDSCYCGFEDYFGIMRGLGLIGVSDEGIKVKAKEFLSDKYKIVCTEKYAGICFEKTGEIL